MVLRFYACEHKITVMPFGTKHHQTCQDNGDGAVNVVITEHLVSWKDIAEVLYVPLCFILTTLYIRDCHYSHLKCKKTELSCRMTCLKSQNYKIKYSNDLNPDLSSSIFHVINQCTILHLNLGRFVFLRM